ncbi:unnamed protein product [Adineta steineri]|uniref:Uncharacterized protein n=1 Tax=Adineta steineri TaxID=433720 RepID=A0A814KKZ2_9BILA|nr:unnamed protein product [Adineta steineri]CAF3502417.1 unnamed protein product [Adineta steineri]
MSKHYTSYDSNNIPPIQSTNKINFINYNVYDAAKRETILKEQEAHRTWTKKYDPWFINEYRQMYDNMAEVRGIPRESSVISLKRTEWQQPSNIFPPLNQRLNGQCRRRILGAFPETENDKIGWRVLPEHTIELYGRFKTANDMNPLPKQYRISNWPIESLY